MMTMYSSENCLDSHRVRVVLAEKGLNVEIIHIEQDRSAIGDLAELSPYGEPPTLVDRDLVVYGTWVVTEYLDERYPHPPLMPVDPVSRSRLRLALYRIHRDWIENGRIIETSTGPKRVETARKQLRDSIRVGPAVRPVAISPPRRTQPRRLCAAALAVATAGIRNRLAGKVHHAYSPVHGPDVQSGCFPAQPDRSRKSLPRRG